MYFIKLPPHLCSKKTYPVKKVPSLEESKWEHLHCGGHTAEGKREDDAGLHGSQVTILTNFNTSEAMRKVNKKH